MSLKCHKCGKPIYENYYCELCAPNQSELN